MNQKLEFKARYFNGKSAIPEQGVASFQNNFLSFQSETLVQKFSVDSLANFETTPLGCKFSTLPDELYESPVIEIFCDKKERKEIESIWFEIKKKQNSFNRLLYSIKQMDLGTLFLFGLFFAFLIGAGFYMVLLKLYLLFPISFDQKFGEKVNEQIKSQFAFCTSNEAQIFLERVTKELKPKNSPFVYDIKIIDRPELNAFTLSGGKIYVFSGLLQTADTPEEVIGVLAHELAHVEKRHHTRNLIKAMGTALAISVVIGPGLGEYEMIETVSELGTMIAVLKFSRDFETEADVYAIELLKNSNYPLTGLYRFFQRLEKEENAAGNTKKPEESKAGVSDQILDFSTFMKTHPKTENRMRILQSSIDLEKNQKWKSTVSKETWKRIQKACVND
ncbi:hypothetical protein LPTSP3_g34050 [Leptospira kobayashii]|uniref:Peptidase M48 domain-containing protein n=1 Tax=Leptospira kobayashii TaxID=1917830 RepID=A0ABN6KNJ3_9LEPT|nr:M48 family metallopeptidase [Leptospira kobayashii]BDA80475.1 hypothetical protein LPTSP3_g34050 [Leptospira kobayashii]